MAWNKIEIQMERLKFVLEAEKGERSMSALCSDYGIKSRINGSDAIYLHDLDLN